MFSFAFRRGWIRENPCARVERFRVPVPAPVILSPRIVAKVFVYVRRRYPSALAWFALATFAGIRPQEIDRLRWENINLDEAVVTVDAAASKVHQRRIVNLHPTARAWIQYAKDHDAKLGLSRSTIRRVIRAVGKRLNLIPWPHDCLRKSCASYLIASGVSVYAVADQLGNSPRILLRHYRQLVTRKQADRFWGLLPRTRTHKKSTP